MRWKNIMNIVHNRFSAARSLRIRRYVIICLLLAMPGANTKHPVVFIHGFLGWGEDEMLGYRYWGGYNDILAHLRSKGYNVHCASVGPISSNHDRAIEAYYQIKGGSLDYGVQHSQEFNLVRKPGIEYDGLFPDWGPDNPIHIIAHSQGGQTARVLEYLLNNTNQHETSDLLRNEHSGWIKSITTISTPHEGTQLASMMVQSIPFIQSLSGLTYLASSDQITSIYDFNLYQWQDLDIRSDEPFLDYLSRLMNHPISESKNFCSWDLSPAGAVSINTYAAPYNETAYFSYSTSSTAPVSNNGKHFPSSITSLDLWPSSMVMGYYNSDKDTVWNENDGIVNTWSMAGPRTPANIWEGLIVPYNKNMQQTGVWQDMGKVTSDHHAIIGHGLKAWPRDSLYLFYEKHIRILSEYE